MFESKLLLHSFNILLIAAYLLCGYAQVTEYRYSNSLKDITFIPAKSSNSARTNYFATSLPKHILNVSQTVFEDLFNDDPINISFARCLIAHYISPDSKKPFKILSALPLNKAPPLS